MTDIRKIAIDTIGEQQAKTLVNSDRDNLLYLMGFNDGVIELANSLISRETICEKEGEE